MALAQSRISLRTTGTALKIILRRVEESSTLPAVRPTTDHPKGKIRHLETTNSKRTTPFPTPTALTNGFSPISISVRPSTPTAEDLFCSSSIQETQGTQEDRKECPHLTKLKTLDPQQLNTPQEPKRSRIKDKDKASTSTTTP